MLWKGTLDFKQELLNAFKKSSKCLRKPHSPILLIKGTSHGKSASALKI